MLFVTTVGLITSVMKTSNFLLLLLLFNQAYTLKCISTICMKENICEDTCNSIEGCVGTYYITNRTVTALMMKCYKFIEGECESSNCIITGTSSPFGTCCCRSDLCTKYPVIVNQTPGPTITIPSTISRSITSPPTVPVITNQTHAPTSATAMSPTSIPATNLSLSVDHLNCKFLGLNYQGFFQNFAPGGANA